MSSPAVPRDSVICVVDDMPDLTELYTAILEATGYTVRAFNDRKDALDALKYDGRMPISRLRLQHAKAASRFDMLFQLPIAKCSAIHFKVIVISRRSGAV